MSQRLFPQSPHCLTHKVLHSEQCCGTWSKSAGLHSEQCCGTWSESAGLGHSHSSQGGVRVLSALAHTAVTALSFHSRNSYICTFAYDSYNILTPLSQHSHTTRATLGAWPPGLVDAAGCGSWQDIESALCRIAQFVCRVQAMWQKKLRGTDDLH